MTPWLLVVVSFIYLFAGFVEGFGKNMWWLGFWSSYASANLFYIMATRS